MRWTRYRRWFSTPVQNVTSEEQQCCRSHEATLAAVNNYKPSNDSIKMEIVKEDRKVGIYISTIVNELSLI